MSSSKLDQIVKGAPPPGTSVPVVASRSPSPTSSGPPAATSLVLPTESPSQLPSSPPQIYLNLLILEASLRSQYLTLRNRRRQNIFFILLLSWWVAGFTYLLFFRLREDGSGVGGSVYWVVEMTEKVALMVGIVTGILIWGTGQWDRGVRWPRRWLGVANRGLRSINAKIVCLLPPTGTSFNHLKARQHEYGVEEELELVREEDLLTGGDHIKLLLLPKPFSPDFRENWELYRLEYWERENERRAQLRQGLRQKEKALAKDQGHWLWRGRGRRGARPPEPTSRGDNEKHHHNYHREKERQRRHSSARSESHSRNASRSSTPSTLDAEERPSLTKGRSGSATATTSDRRRRPKPSSSAEEGLVSKLSLISRPA